MNPVYSKLRTVFFIDSSYKGAYTENKIQQGSVTAERKYCFDPEPDVDNPTVGNNRNCDGASFRWLLFYVKEI